MLTLIEKRWGDAEIFAPLDPDTKRTVLSRVVVNVCRLGGAIDAGELTTDRAVEIAVAATTTIAHTAERTGTGGRSPSVRRGTP